MYGLATGELEGMKEVIIDKEATSKRIDLDTTKGAGWQFVTRKDGVDSLSARIRLY